MPSRSNSASARRMLPGAASSGNRRAVDDPARLACTWCAPRPGAVVAFARELDVDPAPHAERQRYQRWWRGHS